MEDGSTQYAARRYWPPGAAEWQKKDEKDSEQRSSIAAGIALVVIFFGVRRLTREKLPVRVAESQVQDLVRVHSTNGRVEPLHVFEAHSPAVRRPASCTSTLARRCTPASCWYRSTTPTHKPGWPPLQPPCAELAGRTAMPVALRRQRLGSRPPTIRSWPPHSLDRGLRSFIEMGAQKDMEDQGGTSKVRERFTGGGIKTPDRLYGSLKVVDSCPPYRRGIPLRSTYPNDWGALATAGNLVFGDNAAGMAAPRRPRRRLQQRPTIISTPITDLVEQEARQRHASVSARS